MPTLSYTEFITEAANFSALNKEMREFEFASELSKRCGAYLKALSEGRAQKLYRGTSLSQRYSVYAHDGSSYKLSLAKDNNWMELLMDNSPRWSEYPKRGHSITCDTDPEHAARFGRNLFVVVPADGVRCGSSPSVDMYVSFPRAGLTSTQAYRNYKRFFDEIHEYLTGYSISTITSPRELDRFFSLCERERSGVRELVYGGMQAPVNTKLPYVQAVTSKSGTVRENLESVLDPTQNGFVSTLLPNNPSSEVWLEGPAYMVRAELWDRTMDTLSKRVTSAS